MLSRNSRIGLSMTLAVGLGIMLTSTIVPSEAMGHPAGPTISTGSNPIGSGGGRLSVPTSGTNSDSLVTAAESEDQVITDLIFQSHSSDYGCMETFEVTVDIAGTVQGKFMVMPPYWKSAGYNYAPSNNAPSGTVIQFSSGIRVPAGQVATLTVEALNRSGCGGRTAYLLWTWSGYSAQP